MDEHVEEKVEKNWDRLKTAVNELSSGVRGLDNVESNPSSITEELERDIHGG